MTVVYDMPSEPRPCVCDRKGQLWYGDSDGWRRGGHTDDQPVPWRTLVAEYGPLAEKPSDEEAREYAIRVLAWAAERMLASAETLPEEDRRAVVNDCVQRLLHWAHEIQRCYIAAPIQKEAS